MTAPTVWTEPHPGRIRGFVADVVVVDSTDALVLHEAGHTPVWYFPPDAVPAELLVPSDTHTFCPRKGTASYWSLRVGDRLIPDAIWTYPDPIEGRDDIRGYLAFYADRIDSWSEDDPT
jgi:uncharacterized protein (DUF427 family)